MKSRLLLFLSILVTVQCVTSQEKKWNVEANYAIVASDGFSGDYDFIDVGIKYRFVRLGIVRLGFGINGGYTRNTAENTGFESRIDDTYLIQPRFFSELSIPGLESLRTSVGLGYSLVNDVTNFTTTNDIEGSNSGWNQGFNFNLGLSYNFSRRFFIQAQYDFIDLTPENSDDDGVFVFSSEGTGNLNNIRIGLGFRF